MLTLSSSGVISLITLFEEEERRRLKQDKQANSIVKSPTRDMAVTAIRPAHDDDDDAYDEDCDE
jgi:hypothetical protein